MERTLVAVVITLAAIALGVIGCRHNSAADPNEIHDDFADQLEDDLASFVETTEDLAVGAGDLDARVVTCYDSSR